MRSKARSAVFARCCLKFRFLKTLGTIAAFIKEIKNNEHTNRTQTSYHNHYLHCLGISAYQHNNYIYIKLKYRRSYDEPCGSRPENSTASS